MLARSIRGSEGRITLPSIGALIGEMFNWQLYSENGKDYNLRASCNHLHESLWEEAGNSRRIELRIGKDDWYAAKLNEDASIERNGRNLTIKGLTLARMEKD
jgi:hypothetical protein